MATNKEKSEGDILLQKKESPTLPYFITAIGASAGGLEAITELFDNIPKNTGSAFIIISHLSPDYKSLLAELLSKHTEMKVSDAEDGMLVKPDHVYVIPSKKTMTIKHAKLRLSDKIFSQAPNMAIDMFLYSLAEEKGNQAIAIILSGTGTDGTKGIEAIKRNGGMVIVQDPISAKFDGMPNSAITYGNADFILAPEFMPEEIVNFIKGEPLEKAFNKKITEADEPALLDILHIINKQTTCDFTLYKRPTIIRRIIRRMAHNNINELGVYLNFLHLNKEEVTYLCKEFLIGVTKFFRDQEAFEIIQKTVLPEIFEKKFFNQSVKIWVAGCSTGEEAYTLAILIKEYLLAEQKNIEVKIFASDIDKDAVEFAGRGLYSDNILNDVSPERIENFFIKEGTKYRITPEIRKMIIFAPHNLIKDAPFGKIDLISCRNLMIYLSPILQKKVLSTFHFSLNVGGYLFLGPSESPGEIRNSVADIDKKWKIYKNIQVAKSTGSELIFNSDFNIPGQGKLLPTLKSNASAWNIHEVYNDLIVEKYACAGIFIDDNNEVKQAVGDYKKFLNLPEKQMNLSLLKMVPQEIAITLSTAIRKAQKNKEKIELKKLKVKEQKAVRYITVSIKPLLTANGLSSNLTLLHFVEEEKIKANPKDSSAIEEHPETREYLFNLENELQETKAHLQSAIEELETSNEELQSSNEELVSSNEELQSTNEELQSLNEELHTVNVEHQLKIRELINLNDDFTNYFRSTEIGQVFLDSDHIIRKYTPAVTSQINLIETDIGRPIYHISNNIKYQNLMNDIDEVTKKGSVISKEIEDYNGNCYQMKMMPYLRMDKKSDGVVITFIDITKLKKLSRLVAAVNDSSLNGIMAFTVVREKEKIKDFEWILINPSSEKIIGKKSDKLLGKRMLQEMPAGMGDDLFDRYVKVVETGQPLHVEHSYIIDGINKWLEIAAVKLDDGIAVTLNDITDKKLYEENLQKRTKDLQESEDRLRLAVDAAELGTWDLNPHTGEFNVDDKCRELFGLSEEGKIDYNNLLVGIHPLDKDRVDQTIKRSLIPDGGLFDIEFRTVGVFIKKLRWVRATGKAYFNDSMEPIRFIGTIRDITDKQTEKEIREKNDELKKINNDLDNFIYTASHDLKAPVSNIEGLINTLADILDAESLKNENVEPILKMINACINQFSETIKDLTTITKIQRNTEEETEMVNIIDLVEEVKLSIGDLIQKSKGEIKVSCTECPEIKFSKKNLKSIVYNLISNAIKYQYPNRKPEIFIKTELIDGYILLSIKDNGLGIPVDKTDKIFAMFKRFHDHVEGTGVGLYIVKRIINNAGGMIEVESEVNKGTIFKVFFKN